MRIVHLDSGRELRGGQRQLLLLAQKLREHGHEQVIVCRDGSDLEARLRQHHFEVYPLASGGGPLPGLVPLRRQLSRRRFQVLHAHDGRSQTVSALGSLGLPVARVATRRVTFMPQGLWRTLGTHRLQYGPACDAIIAVSGFIRDLLVQAGIRPSKIEVIPDGVEIPPTLPDSAARARARREWELDPEDFIVGHAGAFTREKGQDVLLEAFLEASDRIHKPRLLLMGDGLLRGSPPIVESLRRGAGRARIVAPMEDLTSFFAAIDVYVMPSRTEGLGSSALLAMAHGIAVIASRVGGLTEVVAEGETGWLVPPESAAALADALIAAASNPEARRRFALCARERVRAFSSDTMVGRTEALYRRLIAPAGLSLRDQP